MPPPASAAEFLELVGKSGLLPGDALRRYASELPSPPPDPARLASFLVKQNVLSKLQARLLLAGKWKGFIIGTYVIREEIGKGGMGAVYLAEHRTLRRPVALKILLGDKVNMPGAVDRFFREARAAAALDHPNIVRVFDVGQQGESYYLVMEYVPGTTLDKILDTEKTLAVERAVGFIAQAAAGLQHAYEQGFVHRDIKPANMMVTPDNVLKILDMGLARSLCKTDDVTGIKDRDAILGTADFVSPEQAIGDGELDIRSDLYSLGATFYNLLTGKTPFSGNVAHKLIHHQQTPPPRATDHDSSIPEELSDIIVRMMAKQPDDRFQTPLEVVLAVAPWLPAGSPLLAALSVDSAVGSGIGSGNLAAASALRPVFRDSRSTPFSGLPKRPSGPPSSRIVTPSASKLPTPPSNRSVATASISEITTIPIPDELAQAEEESFSSPTTPRSNGPDRSLNKTIWLGIGILTGVVLLAIIIFVAFK